MEGLAGKLMSSKLMTELEIRTQELIVLGVFPEPLPYFFGAITESSGTIRFITLIF